MKHKQKHYKWLVLAVMCLAFFSPSYAQYQLSSLGTQLMEQYGLRTEQFATIFSAPMIPAVLFCLVAGLLADRLGSKRVIAFGLLLSALGTFGRLFAGSRDALFWCMLFSGFGAAFLSACAAKILGSWFAPRQLNAVMGLFLSTSTLGMAVGMGTTAMLRDSTQAYWVSAVLSLVVLAVWLICMEAPHPTNGGGAPAPVQAGDSLWRTLRIVLACPAVWLAGGALMAMQGCILTLNTFLPTALATRGIDAARAGGYGAAVSAGILAGCLLGPWIFRRIRWVRLALLLSAGSGALLGMGSWQLAEGPLLIAGLLGTGFFCGVILPLVTSLPVRLAEIGPRYAGTAGGMISTMQMLGAVVIPSWIIAPIAANHFPLLFGLGGGCMFLALGLLALLPRRCFT